MTPHVWLCLSAPGNIEKSAKGNACDRRKNGLHKREKPTGAYGSETGIETDSLFKGCCLPNQKAGKTISRSASTRD